MIELPKDIMKDINIAKEILLREGVYEIYVFGSIAEGNYVKQSDIDLAIKGLPEDRYFKVYGELLGKLSRNLDLISLDYKNDFSKMIKETGKLERIA